MADVELLPCPFCGAGKTEIRENGRPWLGQRYGDPSSVAVRHWCEPIEGQPSRMIERVGRDRAAAIAAWNTRATDANLAPLQAEIEALRAEQEVIVAEAKKYAGESGRLKARVELLAEALRLAEEHIDFITPKWYSAGQRVLAAIRAALRDHDQENDDA